MIWFWKFWDISLPWTLSATEGLVQPGPLCRIKTNSAKHKVCRRIYLASKERTVWTNALYRAKCPLPLVDVNSTPTEELERILVRMEIIHAKWTGARRTSPRVYRDFTGSESDPFQHSTVLCAMGPYIVCARNDRNGGRTTWYHKDNLLEKVAEHLSQLTVCRFFQSETGTFYISEMGSRDSNAGPRKM
jgi:hypothetical protein